MGKEFNCKCNKCGYKIHAMLGVGFMYPKVYAETVKKMKSGEYGEQGRKFFDEHPDGAITCEQVITRCITCGAYGQVRDITMYVPKPDCNPSEMNHSERWSVAFPFEGADYVSWMDLEKYYDKYEKFDHNCSECGGGTEIIPMFDFEMLLNNGSLKCPKCDGILKIKNIVMWD